MQVPNESIVDLDLECFLDTVSQSKLIEIFNCILKDGGVIILIFAFVLHNISPFLSLLSTISCYSAGLFQKVVSDCCCRIAGLFRVVLFASQNLPTLI